MGNLDFDATGVEPAQDFAPIPPGDYEAIIGATEIKPTRSNDGHFLSIEHVIFGGEYEKRKIWNNLNLWNKSEKAVQIAQQTLSAICHAIGKMQVSNHEELFGQKVIIRVDIEPDQNGKMRNVVKGYKSASGVIPASSSPAPTTAQAAPATAQPTASAAVPKKAAPWGQK